ncbi:hypothetical protein E8E12_004835 [Didymella heteroderae]|uniref:Uncharacterized protein n=1 Tax=Didymella heteroderae TaxID=1769908 RepID=A0A9P5BZ92_9PLEO|nr:hypothetical protein E8E12_004835 [Didymella heteroderae]
MAVKSTTELIIRVNARNTASKIISRFTNEFNRKVILNVVRESMNASMAMLEETVAQDKADAWDTFDNMLENVILHLVSEDRTPMNTTTALNFLSRNGHLITIRRNMT